MAMARETTSIWNHKPWWCQPWSIVLTGVGAVTGSWIVLQRWWISAPLGLAVLMWWILFLVLVPRAWQASVENSAAQAEDSCG